ncbi:Endoribonuclease L-PSP/chorismate mutase-like protein [Kockovaella imperatae]|uniref:Endoribonuclease L-PSP/chorismate mutase-like protein n=1 Tax=Kockovaella imperatae TaxID=4999 RepID=A0A1Y1U778_9TREE|nr:Endoribonuclease L-PSP/chorismate mutase-like protein [Kockovaella imperatae]ORX33862.1 Endoribonuclease L-PSP/chorismate mutase-like protein [Kockovaella imperatae]
MLKLIQDMRAAATTIQRALRIVHTAPSHPSTSFITFTRSLSSTRSIMSASPYTVVSTDKAPAAIGPYVQATKYNGLIYASGCIPLDPKSMEVVSGGIEEQTKQVFANVAAVLAASSSAPSHVLKCVVFLKSMNDFVAVNKLYAEFFGETKPARSCVEVARLPKDVLVEIEFIAAEQK